MTITPTPSQVLSPTHIVTSNTTTSSLVHIATIPISILNDVNLSGNIIFSSSSYPYLWFHRLSTLNFMNYITTSGCGPRPEEPFLVGFQPPREVIHTYREGDFMIFIFEDNPSSTYSNC